MGPGIVANTTQNAPPAIAARKSAWPSADARWSGKILDDDSATAAIHNAQRDKDSRVRWGINEGASATTFRRSLQRFTGAFSDSLARFREMSGEVAAGRFSPTTLRDQVRRLKEATKKMGANSEDNLTGLSSFLAFLESGDFKSASKGAVETRALAWLRDDARSAALSQQNIEPGRALHLLKGMVTAEGVNSSDR